jgi:hypothetical protein
MWRTIASVVAGLIAWGLIVTLLNFGLRAAIPGYHAAEATMEFTLAMKIGRLVEAALASLASGAVIRAIAPTGGWAPWIVGLLLLAMFLPVHIGLWTRFPVWYHLAFLVPLAPLVPLGASLLRKRPFQPATSPV